MPLYSYTTIQLCQCPVIPLPSNATVQLYHCPITYLLWTLCQRALPWRGSHWGRCVQWQTAGWGVPTHSHHPSQSYAPNNNKENITFINKTKRIGGHIVGGAGGQRGHCSYILPRSRRSSFGDGRTFSFGVSCTCCPTSAAPGRASRTLHRATMPPTCRSSCPHDPWRSDECATLPGRCSCGRTGNIHSSTLEAILHPWSRCGRHTVGADWAPPSLLAPADKKATTPGCTSRSPTWKERRIPSTPRLGRPRGLPSL